MLFWPVWPSTEAKQGNVAKGPGKKGCLASRLVVSSGSLQSAASALPPPSTTPLPLIVDVPDCIPVSVLSLCLCPLPHSVWRDKETTTPCVIRVIRVIQYSMPSATPGRPVPGSARRASGTVLAYTCHCLVVVLVCAAVVGRSGLSLQAWRLVYALTHHDSL